MAHLSLMSHLSALTGLRDKSNRVQMIAEMGPLAKDHFLCLFLTMFDMMRLHCSCKRFLVPALAPSHSSIQDATWSAGEVIAGSPLGP